MGKLETFPLRSVIKHGDPPCLFPFNTVLEVLANMIDRENSIRGMSVGEEGVKLSLADIKAY